MKYMLLIVIAKSWLAGATMDPQSATEVLTFGDFSSPATCEAAWDAMKGEFEDYAGSASWRNTKHYCVVK